MVLADGSPGHRPIAMYSVSLCFTHYQGNDGTQSGSTASGPGIPRAVSPRGCCFAIWGITREYVLAMWSLNDIHSNLGGRRPTA